MELKQDTNVSNTEIDNLNEKETSADIVGAGNSSANKVISTPKENDTDDKVSEEDCKEKSKSAEEKVSYVELHPFFAVPL